MSNPTNALNPPVRVLLGPGPSDTHPRVLSALAKPTLGHLDPEYLKIMDDSSPGCGPSFKRKTR